MKLRARWTGTLPRAGDYLASPIRPRFAYKIRGVTRIEPLVRWDDAAKAEVRRVAIEVDRVALASVEPAARIHPWRWDKRASTRHLIR